MRRIFLSADLVAIGFFLFAFSASAQSNATLSNRSMGYSLHLEGDTALHFIAAYFPDAHLPIDSPFTYTAGQKTGYAQCDWPAMGARSEGTKTSCELKQGGKSRHLAGRAAESFIARNFPDADLPGDIEGIYGIGGTLKSETGHARCFLREVGDVQKPICDIEY